MLNRWLDIFTLEYLVKNSISMIFYLLSIWLISSHLSFSAVVRINLTQKSKVLDGQPFNLAGSFERLEGKIFFEIDPTLKENRKISDISLAPLNARGKVAFSSNFYILRPTSSSKRNGTVLYEVANRGRKGMLGMFNLAKGSLDPRSSSAFGDGFLLNQGFTLAWLGWQFDIPPGKKLLRLTAPIATEGENSITGLVRSEFVPNKKVLSFSLADRNMPVVYPALDIDEQNPKLTVRELTDGPRKIIPRHLWKFGQLKNGRFSVSRTHIFLPTGFNKGRIYELVYPAKNPMLVGLGLAATRDFISFLKFGSAEEHSSLNGLDKSVKRAIGFGNSQSGRFLRTFLYYGFNVDEQQRPSFDGVFSHVAGASRGSFNHRFAQPSRDAHAFMNTFFPTVVYPFADLPQFDPETDFNEGLISHYSQGNATPKIFYSNASYEYYGRAASLIHTSLDGTSDSLLAKNTRIYLFAGTQHGPASFPPRKTGTVNLPNPNNFRFLMRALVLSLNRWLQNGTPPPPSQYPRISQNQLVSLKNLSFPKIPGINLPQRMMRPYRLDYGPKFQSERIATLQPPKVGKAFQSLVPQVDRDGNELAGIRLPGIKVPLATYTGWNLRHYSLGAPEELYSMVGSFIPFPINKKDRLSTGDPRLSIAERYDSRSNYLKKIKTEAIHLEKIGFLLNKDVPNIINQAAILWDYLVTH